MIEVKTTDEIDAMLAVRGRRRLRQGFAIGAIVALAAMAGVSYKLDVWRTAQFERRLQQQVATLRDDHVRALARQVAATAKCQDTVSRLSNADTGIVANLMREIDQKQGVGE